MSMNWDPRTEEFPHEWFNEAFPVPGRDTGVFTEVSLRDVFTEFDSDNKGYITRADVRRILNILGDAVSEDDLDQMMLLMDPEGSDGVSQDQFVLGLLFSNPLFQNPTLVPESVSILPVRHIMKARDDVQSELNRAADERRILFQEVTSEGRMKANDIKKIFGRFHELDKEKKGSLNYPNFLLAMQRADSESSRRLFDLLDKDCSGELDLKEFILGLSQFTDAPKEDRVRFTFKLFDTDNSGTIDREELTKIVRSAAPTSAQPQWISMRVNELYDSVGLGHGSLIDLETFIQLAKKNEHFIAPVIDDFL